MSNILAKMDTQNRRNGAKLFKINRQKKIRWHYIKIPTISIETQLRTVLEKLKKFLSDSLCKFRKFLVQLKFQHPLNGRRYNIVYTVTTVTVDGLHSSDAEIWPKIFRVYDDALDVISKIILFLKLVRCKTRYFSGICGVLLKVTSMDIWWLDSVIIWKNISKNIQKKNF